MPINTNDVAHPAFDRPAFARTLTEVARRYFEKDGIDPEFGICFNAKRTGDSESYDKMRVIMYEMKEPDAYYGGSAFLGGCKDWEPRAWMCLFLAEYLT